ncbi:MAG: glycosyltransferase [Candidatus Cloacimonetes bacterium]|nr:glycosyltransferase [Candidatus Cloacimonadota bacterium]
MNEKVDLSVILPCYNEASHFEKSVEQIIAVLVGLRQKTEIIFVDDKSLDNTRELINNLISEFRHKKVSLRRIFHEKNQGRGKAVSNGIMQAKGKIVGFLDIDLEVPAYYIPEFANQIRNGADVAIGHRIYAMQPATLHRWFASRGYNFLVRRLLNLKFSDTEAGYKFFKREKILPILEKVRDQYWFWDTEITWRCFEASLRIVEVPCLFLRRTDKKSTVRFFEDSIDYLIKILKFKKQLSSKKSI